MWRSQHQSLLWGVYWFYSWREVDGNKNKNKKQKTKTICCFGWHRGLSQGLSPRCHFSAVLYSGFVPLVDVEVSICLNQPNCHPEDADSKFPQNSEQTHYTAQYKKPQDHHSPHPPPLKNPHNSNTQLLSRNFFAFHDQRLQQDWVYTWRNFMGLQLKISLNSGCWFRDATWAYKMLSWVYSYLLLHL